MAVDSLADLAGPDWAEALQAAPREKFVPDRAWTIRDGLLDRADDPDTWRAAVESDTAIVTQIDDGQTDLTATSPWTTLDWTSSCSAPNMVFAFLKLLDPYPGDRVLEIGTGTGWTAALLSAKLGAERVTSIDVDSRVAEQAAANLKRAGFHPHLITGDGALGYPEGALYDRVHVTCGVRDIPYAWVRQTRPGGIIALPWIPNGSGGGHKSRLVVTGESAVGRFHGSDAAYMMLRSQRPSRPPIVGDRRASVPRVDPRRLSDAGPGLAITLAGMLPGVSLGGGEAPDGAHRYSLRHLPSDSHALAELPANGDAAEVGQRGPRSLWDEVEAAYLTWVGWGEPGAERFGLTIDPDGQHVWLDRPDNRIAEVGG